ncbi:hypothetical protein [Haladaptatus sp. YSMS36]|uniref:hypothetical protein n=1 Tax=Haladaptatus sp. YSMS36 TaxID=3033384 RepID=UPI0023E807B5|nr:hypothetical protein [Haladaptatus sp. YSMS36]
MSINTTLFEDAHRNADCSLQPETLAIHPWVSEASKLAREYDLNTVLEDISVRDRAVERLVTGVNTGTILMPHNLDLATEYLSYAVARIIVSSIDDHRVTNRYIDAEADRAINLMESALWHPSSGWDAYALFDEFDMDVKECTVFEMLSEERRKYASDEARQHAMFQIPVEQYLTASIKIQDESWRLVNRGVQNGFVYLSRKEVTTFLRAAIKVRIGEKLPLPLNDDIEVSVTEPVERVHSSIDKDLFTHEIDRVEAGLFPPVIKSMLDDFPHNLLHEQKHTLAAFFLKIGMTPDEVVEALGVVGTQGEDPTRYQVEHIWRGGNPYMPANYDTIKSWGYEWEMDALEQKVKNPLSYYRIKLEKSSKSNSFVWLDVYDQNVSPMLTYPAGPVSEKMDADSLPEGFTVSDDGATWNCDTIGDQFATGLALVAVVSGYIQLENLSMKFLKEMDSTDAVNLCVEAIVRYGFSRTPPTYILEHVGKVYSFEFVKGEKFLSKTGKRDAQNAFDSLVNKRNSEIYTQL